MDYSVRRATKSDMEAVLGMIQVGLKQSAFSVQTSSKCVVLHAK